MSVTEGQYQAAANTATSLMEDLIKKYGTTGNVVEGNRQWHAIYYGALEVQKTMAEAERELEREFDRLEERFGPLDRDAVRALANVYVERGDDAHAALAAAAERLKS